MMKQNLPRITLTIFMNMANTQGRGQEETPAKGLKEINPDDDGQ